jgi:hypothetical protein
MKEGLIKARSHIIFILGLIAAFGVVIGLEKLKIEKPVAEKVKIIKTATIPKLEPRALTVQEQAWAGTAWKYFENNYRPETGMVNSVDGFPASTMWDTASYIMALVAAERLELITSELFDQRLSLLLDTLTALPLFESSLPNKSYNTVNASMVDYNNQPTTRGIGWSAIDMGRLLTPFNIIVWSYPSHTEKVRTLLKRWGFKALLGDGQLFGSAIDEKGRTVFLQEGRIGYEQYAAKSLGLMGLDVSRALDYVEFLGWVDVYGIQVPYDLRDPEKYHAHNYVVSEPYILDGLEFGWDAVSEELAYRVYRAQEERFKNTNVLTAVSEDHIDQPPYFIYNTVFTDGKIWNCITEQGKDASRFKSLSTKAAFGWHMLYRTDYTEKLIQKVSKLYDPEKGWFSGEYEADGQPNKAITCNTNAIVLESLCYKKFGPMVVINQ